MKNNRTLDPGGYTLKYIVQWQGKARHLNLVSTFRKYIHFHGVMGKRVILTERSGGFCIKFVNAMEIPLALYLYNAIWIVTPLE